MIATRQWHCQCGCNELIQPGEQMRIEGGMIYREEHTTGDLFEDIPKVLTKQVKITEQKPLFDLPLFSKAEFVQQVSLF